MRSWPKLAVNGWWLISAIAAFVALSLVWIGGSGVRFAVASLTLAFAFNKNRAKRGQRAPSSVMTQDAGHERTSDDGSRLVASPEAPTLQMRESNRARKRRRAAVKRISTAGTLSNVLATFSAHTGPHCGGACVNNRSIDPGHVVTRYACVNNKGLEKRFQQTRAKLGAHHVPELVYHGTRRSNIASICKRGLLLPGHEGVKVVNGSAHGVGIYTARRLGLPMRYSSDCNMLLVCLGLIGPKDSPTATKEVGDVLVFFDEKLVVPIYVVEYRLGSVAEKEAAGQPMQVSLAQLVGPPQIPPTPQKESQPMECLKKKSPAKHKVLPNRNQLKV